MSSPDQKVSNVEIRMFRMGTGDCFVLKFLCGETSVFNLMIDAGCWTGGFARLSPFVEELKSYVENKVDLLIVTHEHQDHVLAFGICEDLFTNDFEVKEIWMGWSENDEDPKVNEWKTKFGEKKKALYGATKKLKQVNEDPVVRASFKSEKFGTEILSMKDNFISSLSDFLNLHFDEDIKTYVSSLKGMDVVKNKIAKSNIIFKTAGEILEKKDRLPGVKFYILGPPQEWEEVKKEKGEHGEGYEHNKDLPFNESFSAAARNLDEPLKDELIPFDSKFITNEKVESYINEENNWRNIDHDWLNSAGMLALRINSKTNNLSLAIAIEFEDSGKVFLFPGDAEFGSWESWHRINWGVKNRNGSGQLTTEELLNRTVFYKVAHHLSHNGTARRPGLDMMTSKELVAMATLDYGVISPQWLTTMPNKAVIDDLLEKTQGRLLIMEEKKLPYDRKKGSLLSDEIKRRRKLMPEEERLHFLKNLKTEQHYIQYNVEV